MKRLIAITTPCLFEEEATLINRLFGEGLQTLHLRKPEAEKSQLSTLLEQIEPVYYPRIILHDHFDLAPVFALGGVHLNRRNSEVPAGRIRLPVSQPYLPQHLEGRIWRRIPPGSTEKCHEARPHNPADYCLGRDGRAHHPPVERLRIWRCGGIRGFMGKEPSTGGGAKTLLSIKTSYRTDMNTKFEGANRLMLITHQTDTYTDYEEAELFLKGGGSWVQLRQKEGVDIEMARRLVTLCREKNGVLCVDDNINIALEIGADAVHLGKNDMPVNEAWEQVRKAHRETDFLIGATTNTFEDIQRAASLGASYIGLGPFRFTQTKKKLSPILGLEGYRRIIEQCEEAEIHLPIYAIGGIELEDIPDLMKTGVHGIAISGSIIRADNPVEMTRRFIEKILGEV